MAVGRKTGGRKAGTPNKATRSLKDALLALRFDVPEELVRIYRDPDLSASAKLKILETLLPYVAPRLKESEVSVLPPDGSIPEPPAPVSTESLIALVTDKPTD